MSNLSHRESVVLVDSSGTPAWGDSYMVTALPVGGWAASASAASPITLRPGHGLKASDKFIVGTDTDKYREVSSVSGNDVSYSGAAIAVAAGDAIVNLGVDTGVSAPNYDGGSIPIWDEDSDASTPEADSTVTCDSLGNYSYWHKGSDHWELIRDSSGTIASVIEGIGQGGKQRNMGDFVRGGRGTSANPFTGWEHGCREGWTNHFPAGYWSTDDFEFAVAAQTANSRTGIVGDPGGGSVITITAAAGQFRVYGSGGTPGIPYNVRITDLAIEAGINNTATGMVSLENLDWGSSVDNLWINPTSNNYTLTLALYVLNCDNTTFGTVSVRGWYDSGATVTTGVHIYTDDGTQRGNLWFSNLLIANCVTGLKINSSGGSLNNITFGRCKVVNSNQEDGTLAVDLDSNAEQITFCELLMETFHNGLDNSGVENLVVLNGLATAIKNAADGAGDAFNITNGDGGFLNCRINNCYNGFLLDGTTNRYMTQRSTSASLTNELYTDSSSGANTYLAGGTISSDLTLSGTVDITGVLGVGSGSQLTISTGAVTATSTYHRIETEGGGSPDDLDTISGLSEGDILIIRPFDDTHTVVAKDGTGNLRLAGDHTMDSAYDTLTLIKVGTDWVELTRSNTG